MAYSNLGTPRFYINYFEYLSNSIQLFGYGGLTPDITAWRTLPVEPKLWGGSGGGIDLDEESGFSDFPEGHFNFLMILGHNARSVDTGYKIVHTTGALATPMDSLVNGGVQGEIDTQWHGQSNVPYMNPGYDGWSLWTLSSTITQFHVVSTDEHNVGSIITGRYYDMPHSPDLKLTMTREMDGVKRIRTKGGADLVDHKYIKPAMWGLAGAWELYLGTPTNQALSRSGRRSWDLSFSYLQDSDVFPVVSNVHWEGSINEDGNTYGWQDGAGTSLLESDNFYSQVIHKTNGGQLPFIFQPDGSNNNPDNFAICKFDMKEFKFEQVANGVYNVKLKIREVW